MIINMAVKHILLNVILYSVLCLVHCYSETDNPDVRLIKAIGQEVWDNRDELLDNVLDNLLFGEKDRVDFREELRSSDDDAVPEERMSCAQCRTFVGTITNFINRGFTFEEVRDEAVVICYGVTDGMGYNGTVMCEGIIDNFGPHVYYVLNVTDLGVREICEFHKQCDPAQNEITVDKVRGQKVARHGDPQPGSSRPRPAKQDMLRIAHISDVHFDDKYTPGSPTDCNLPLCCRDYWEGTGIANEWGDYNCGVPTWTVELLLENLATFQPHVIMQTGDTPSHALWEETQVGQIEYSRWLAEAIQDKVPGVPAYTCIGNHDSYPTNQYYPDRPQIQALNGNFTEMYAPLSGWTEEAVETMAIGGYYSMLVLPGLRIIAINSNFGTTDNFYGVLLPENEGWLQHAEYIESEFLNARQNNEKVILLGHHTIKGSGFTFYDEWVNGLLDTYGDVILFQLQGHSHTDDIQMSSDANIELTTAMFSTSTMGTRTDKNPAFRVYYLDPATYLPLEYEHYFINLTATYDTEETPQVELMYSTSEDYGMADLSLASLDDFIDRLVVDDDLYYLYMWNENTRAPSYEQEDCTGECRQKFACKMRTTTDERYDVCRDQWGQAE